MGYPDRLHSPYGLLDWTRHGTLTFEEPDRSTFRCLDLCYQAGRLGGTAPTWLNAANEVAVEAFLAGGVTWLQIGSIIEETLERHDGGTPEDLDAVLQADDTARRVARERIQQQKANG
jgi:1-deoxy-D-xylulose-5-phosphate reductoisomerase